MLMSYFGCLRSLSCRLLRKGSWDYIPRILTCWWEYICDLCIWNSILLTIKPLDHIITFSPYILNIFFHFFPSWKCCQKVWWHFSLLFVTFWGFYSECPEEMFYWKPVSLIHPVIHLCESFFLNTKQSKSKFSKLFFQEGFLELQFLHLSYSLILVFLFRDFSYTCLVTSLLINYIGYFPSGCFTLVFYFFWIFNFFLHSIFFFF